MKGASFLKQNQDQWEQESSTGTACRKNCVSPVTVFNPKFPLRII
jgi:hypothetical protein